MDTPYLRYGVQNVIIYYEATVQQEPHSVIYFTVLLRSYLMLSKSVVNIVRVQGAHFLFHTFLHPKVKKIIQAPHSNRTVITQKINVFEGCTLK